MYVGMPVAPSPVLTNGESGERFTIAIDHDVSDLAETTALPSTEQKTTWSLFSQGAETRVKSGLNFYRGKRLKSRGVIKDFSRAARLRMVREIAHTDWSAVGVSLFVTLTYPDAKTTRTMRQRTIDRSRFLRYVEKYLGRPISSIWRIEWEKRKSGKDRGKYACHIHLLLYGVNFIPWAVVRAWWCRCIGWKQYAHTWVEATWDGEGAAKYVAKYCAKKSVSPYLVNPSYLNTTGRYWGLTRAKKIPRFAPKIFWNLSESQVTVLVACARALLPFYDGRYDDSFTLIGKHAEEIAALFWENNLDMDAAMEYLTRVETGEGPQAKS